MRRSTWALAAALVAGLAGGAKVEFLPAAMLAVAPALLARRPRKEAVGAIAFAAAVAAAAWAIPIALYGAATMRRHGYLLSTRVPEEWRLFYRGLALGAGPVVLLKSALFVAAAAALARTLRTGARAEAALFAALGAAGGAMGAWTAQALVPLSLALLAWTAARAAKERRPPPLAVAAAGIAMLPAVARQPLSMMPESPYTPFSSPLALLVAWALLAPLLGCARRTAFLALGLAAGLGVGNARAFHEPERTEVRFARGTLQLLPPEAKLLHDGVEAIRRSTPPDSYVAAFPDSALVTFLAERRSPFPDDQFHPGTQRREDEEEIVRLLDERPVMAAFVANRSMPEFGARRYGEGYGEIVMAAIRERMRLVGIVGEAVSGRPPVPGLRANQALLYVRR